MDKQIPVLIVGAGPTGLMMACELARRNIAFRLIDKKPERTLSSNATWIQTRTLELLDQIGIINQFLPIGHHCEAINFYADGKEVARLPLNYIDSTYPFILMLPQSETERVLGDYLAELKGKIERDVELIDVKYDNDIAQSTLRYSDGHTEILSSNWLIACDGANSLIREKCGFHFPGEDLTEQFIVADAEINFSYMPKDEIHFFFDAGTLLAAFPLGENKYRIVANLHLDYPRKIFTEREVIEIVQERAHGSYYVTHVAWISSFWIHSRVAEHLRRGPIFLAGDAAHILSPAGGQGMNTGLQDAYNLAWKLALVIQGKAKSSLLESYHLERHPIVKETVNQNERFTKMALFDSAFLLKLANFSQTLSSDEIDLSKKIGRKLTQLDIQYQNSPIIAYGNTPSPQAGERAPDAIINPSKRLYDYFHHTQHQILLFTDELSEKRELEKIRELKTQLNKAYPWLIKAHCLVKNGVDDLEDIIVDEHGMIHKHYNVTKPTIFIIRPDGYIASRSEELTFSSIEMVLNNYLQQK